MLLWSIVMIRQQGKHLWFLQQKKTKWLLAAILLWVLLVLLDGFRTNNIETWMNEALLKVSLLIVPIYALLLPRDTCGARNSWLIFAIVTTSVALISVVNYGVHYEEINALLLQSKHVPIFGNMHHIYFGVFMSLTIWLCYFYYLKHTYKKLWLTLGVLLLCFLHILASRTGLVAFYLGTLVFLLTYAWQSKRFKLVIVGVSVLLMLPVLGYTLSKSFKNKVTNSVEDLRAVKSGADINYKSLAMRIEAWKTSGRIISNNLLIGVGSDNVTNEMQLQYARDETVLYRENRVGPHNQFIEITIAHGILGGILLVIIVLFWLTIFRTSPIKMAMATVLIVSFFLESFLERQQGILVFSFFLFSFIPLPSREKKDTQD
ncbi:MAG: O-antigen ligase [Bacteroidia bacterium]|jgi:O-antigen ligase